MKAIKYRNVHWFAAGKSAIACLARRADCAQAKQRWCMDRGITGSGRDLRNRNRVSATVWTFVLGKIGVAVSKHSRKVASSFRSPETKNKPSYRWLQWVWTTKIHNLWATAKSERTSRKSTSTNGFEPGPRNKVDQHPQLFGNMQFLAGLRECDVREPQYQPCKWWSDLHLTCFGIGESSYSRAAFGIRTRSAIEVLKQVLWYFPSTWIFDNRHLALVVMFDMQSYQAIQYNSRNYLCHHQYVR